MIQMECNSEAKLLLSQKLKMASRWMQEMVKNEYGNAQGE
jgi:hypothetical protein